MNVEQIPYKESDLPYLREAVEKAEQVFKQMNKPSPVELLDVRPHSIPGHVIIVITYDKPGDLFFLGSVSRRIKDEKFMEKTMAFVDHEIASLLTPNSN